MPSIEPQRWQRLSPWLDEVLALPAGERETWLGAFSQREPVLAAELRALLAGGAAAPGAELLQGAAGAAASMAAFSISPPQAGRRIGAYTLLEPLGEGGMGAVWLAERSDGRYVGRAAVKLLHAGVVQRSLAARFKREGAILARLSHPHIARLVDAGLTDDGQPYLVLEHVAGERIDRWCDTRCLDMRARLQLFAQVLQAVQHAHSQLVVHRDLKPANVMVDAQGAVKLLDFGIAKLLDEGELPADATELTRDGGRVLTPLYAAPEQTRGEPVGTATDVFALGLLLYILLTGQHPRIDARGESIPATGPLPLASRVVTDPARRDDADLAAVAAARGTTPARLAHALAGDVDNILAKALRDEPRERYATVAAFADDVQRHLQGHTVSARPDSLAYRVSRFVGRHKLGVGLSGGALAAIIAMAVVADQQRRAAEHERDAATRQQAVSEAVAFFMEELIGQVGPTGGTRSPAELVDYAQRRAEQLFFDAPEVTARLHRSFWVLNATLARLPERQRNADAMASAAARIDDAIARTGALCSAASEDFEREAIVRIDRLLDALPDNERSRSVRWNCLIEKAEHLMWAGRHLEASEAFEAAHRAAPPLLRRLKEIQYARGRGLVLDGQGRAYEAERAFAEAGRLYEEAGRGRSISMASNLNDRAFLTSLMGRPREAIALAEQAAAIARGAGVDAGLLPVIEVSIAHDRMKLDQPAQALRLIEGALWRDGRFTPRHPRALGAIALAHVLRGEHAQAVAVLEGDLASYAGKGDTMWDTTNRVALAQVWLEKNGAAEALAALDAIGERPGSAAYRWESLWLRARALNVAGRAGEAEAAARAAAAEAGRRAPPQGRSAVHGHAYLELARALAAQGRAAEAREAAERAAAELDDALGPQHSAARAAAALARR